MLLSSDLNQAARLQSLNPHLRSVTGTCRSLHLSETTQCQAASLKWEQCPYHMLSLPCLQQLKPSSVISQGIQSTLLMCQWEYCSEAGAREDPEDFRWHRQGKAYQNEIIPLDPKTQRGSLRLVGLSLYTSLTHPNPLLCLQSLSCEPSQDVLFH